MSAPVAFGWRFRELFFSVSFSDRNVLSVQDFQKTGSALLSWIPIYQFTESLL